ncbi:MAG: glycosyltransferase [Bacteroidia bacterium]
MLSILIPVFNVDVRELVKDLNQQVSLIGIDFEIRLYDDGSDAKYKSLTNELAEIQSVIIQDSDKNIGRSAIRNKLAKEAQGDWLWFLDCDGKVAQNQNLSSVFWKEKSENQIVSGGRIYQYESPENTKLQLHWLWGSQRELLDSKARMKDPVSHFLSNNFIVHKGLFQKLSFDTLLFGYGYEDTLFAAEAKTKGFEVKHIENPVLHDGLEPADAFLKKIEESLDNLHRLKDICAEKNIQFPVKSKLILAYRILNFPIIRQLFGSWFARNASIWRIQLLGKNPDLKTFDAYRLAYLLNQ